ncbi:hypothetical protein BDA96_09G075100 [Sorghum bicolor]|uniref:Acid phosphatase n=1 Tax=Sorghum bicolor TaxID=4558 RepID=A0A921Q806_SORBI|nr:hypothetical protein BDA96_09G075100 [Sorghum bicolor]
MAMAMATAKLVLLMVLVAGSSCGGSAWRGPLSLLRTLPTTTAAQSVEAAAERLKEDVSSAASASSSLIHALRPLMGSAGDLGLRAGVPCDSWRLAVETYNKRDWTTVPGSCEGYVGHYMLGGHYRRDSRVVVDEAIAYAEGLKLAGNGKEVWVFDIDETSLSNLPYYATHGFGYDGAGTRTRAACLHVPSKTMPDGDVDEIMPDQSRTTTKPYNATSFNDYVLEGSAPVLPESQRLFKKLISLGIKPVFLTGRTEDQRAITVTNLRRQGYSGWMDLLLKPVGLKATAIAYKSGERQKLQDAGYVIVGNIGDQWSDILGAPEGARTFKLPDPLYYIG